MMYPQAISHGNVLTFTPPGFRHTLNVKFPDSRLAVCEKCKKNYKTRDMCRVRNSHQGPPWTTAYICITLDDSCTDDDGKYVDKPLTVRMVQWQPFCVKTPFDEKTPVCSSCKKTNRTRSFCRDRHQHTQLPWCTVYVLLSALDKTDPATVVAAPSKPIAGEAEGSETGKDKKSDDGKKAEDEDEDADAEQTKEDEAAADAEKPEGGTADEADGPKADDDAPETKDEKPEKPDDASGGGGKKDAAAAPKKKRGPDEGDDIDAIEESRTFLAMVSCRSSKIRWVQLSEYDPLQVGSNGAANNESTVQALNAAIRNPQMSMPPLNPQQYYAQMAAMGYTPQQQQQAFQMHQQHYYQMQQQHANATPQQMAQQQAAWQAQYNQPPPPIQPGAPAPGAPAPANGEEAPTDQSLPPLPVTAGEAAAAKQKEQHDQNGNGSNGGPAPPPGASQQQQQAHAQWHAQMMYHQQLYHQQMQMHQQHAGGAHPHAPPPPGHPHHPGAPAHEEGTEEDHGVEPTPLTQGPGPADASELDAVDLHVGVEGDHPTDQGEHGEDHHHDAKRQRIDVV